MRGGLGFWLLTALALGACGGSGGDVGGPVLRPVVLDPPIAVPPGTLTDDLPDAAPVLIKDGRILTARLDQPEIERGWLRMRGGRIVGLGAGDAPKAEVGEAVIDASGQWITPGLIDAHSHMGVFSTPSVWAHHDGNELSSPITAGVRVEDAFWPQDPSLQKAVAGGVTTILVLPGSGNVIGGQGYTVKLHPRREARAMHFPGAKNALKMACGENPKRVYGVGRRTMPMTRMGSLFLMRERWAEARRYRNDWRNYYANPTKMEGGQEVPAHPPKRDLVLEALAGALDRELLVHVHCYRADEMLQQIKIAKEFGFEIRSFHHAVEAYKIRDVLAAEDISVSTWADWWGYKIEVHDAIEQNLALLQESGARGILHTDSREGVQRMNQEASKAYWAGVHAGVDLKPVHALRWITANPAWALGVEDQVGTLEVGKMADVVIWNRDPLSVYASAQQVYIDGHLRFDVHAKPVPWSDFEVGQ